jgi:pimeloyl-ACP methyl ester carboxylesterase
MAKVFVHGNPETTFVWSDLVPELNSRGVDDIVLLSPPGFGAPVPDGFPCTRIAYRDWLIGEIESLGGNVDLAGHDWGAGHVFAVAAERPDLLRSWSADVAGLAHPDYEWHPAAQVWQTEGEGEASIADIIALSPEKLTEMFGVPERLAPTMAENLDEVMGDSILKVYRSAVQPAMRDMGDQLAAAERRPALLVDATADVYVPPEMVHLVAERTGAQIMSLEGLGHWWMWEDPGQAAAGFVSFWESV